MGGRSLFYRHLGKTDLNVSVLGLGLVKIGRKTQVKYPVLFELPSDQEVQILLDEARDVGINLLDTAPAYGLSEERLGNFLFKNKNRNDWIICSKAGEEFDPETNQSSYCFTRDHINKSVERSLKKLRTDYLDILLIHSNGDDVRIIEEDNIFETLNILKSQGKIKYFGMSTKTIEGARLAIDQSDVVMLTYNLQEKSEACMIEYAYQQGKGVLIKKGLQSGHANSPEEAIQFIFNQPGVTSLIAGTLSPKHLRENAQAVCQAISNFNTQDF